MTYADSLDWKEFKKRFLERFQAKNEVREARDDLNDLIRGSGSLDIATYSNRFMQIVQRITDMTPVEHYYKYLDGLHPPRLRIEVEQTMGDDRDPNRAMTIAT